VQLALTHRRDFQDILWGQSTAHAVKRLPIMPEDRPPSACWIFWRCTAPQHPWYCPSLRASRCTGGTGLAVATVTDPRLAPTLKGPRLQRFVAVEPAQLVVLRRRRRVRRILGGDARQSGDPVRETAGGIWRTGENEPCCRCARFGRGCGRIVAVPAAQAGGNRLVVGYPRRSPCLRRRRRYCQAGTVDPSHIFRESVHFIEPVRRLAALP
jgi:hypothetical protein